jgi:MFS family permease
MSDTAVAESSFAETFWTDRDPLSSGGERSSSRAGQLRRDLRASLGDAAGSGLMVGTGETYLPAFVLAAGLGEVLAGLIATLPQLAGGIMQLIAPYGVRLVQSHRKWVVTCATVQALAFVPLAIAAWHGGIGTSMVFAAATLYWSAGLASGPPWNTWMGSLIPGRVRPRYFARRNRMQQAAVLTGFLASGLAIAYGASPQNALAGFALLFGLAILGRFGSVACLARTSEPDPLPSNIRLLRWPTLARRFTRGAEAQRLTYLSLVQAAAYFASPYFAPYMLCVLKLSYGEYVLLISTAYVARVISLPLWGSVATHFGTRRLLWIGGLGIVPSAGAWLVSDRFWYLILVQLAGGAAWAAYELAVFLVGVNSVRAEERTSVLSVFNLATTAGIVVGSILGGSVLVLLGQSREVYYILFAGSSILRLGTLYFLPRIPARLLERQSFASARTQSVLPHMLPASASIVAKSLESTAHTGIWRDQGVSVMRRSA